MDKTFEFALDIVQTYKFLVDDKREYVLSKQLLRSGTSIGAKYAGGKSGNIQERVYYQSPDSAQRSLGNRVLAPVARQKLIPIQRNAADQQS